MVIVLVAARAEWPMVASGCVIGGRWWQTVAPAMASGGIE